MQANHKPKTSHGGSFKAGEARYRPTHGNLTGHAPSRSAVEEAVLHVNAARVKSPHNHQRQSSGKVPGEPPRTHTITTSSKAVRMQ